MHYSNGFACLGELGGQLQAASIVVVLGTPHYGAIADSDIQTFT